MQMSRPFEVDGIHMSLWGNSLVGLYAKCGSFEDAWRGFLKCQIWLCGFLDAVYGECGMHGRAKEALKHFDCMHEEGVQPDNVTFLHLLSDLQPCRFGG